MCGIALWNTNCGISRRTDGVGQRDMSLSEEGHKDTPNLSIVLHLGSLRTTSEGEQRALAKGHVLFRRETQGLTQPVYGVAL